MSPLLGTGKVECMQNGQFTVHWWPADAEVGAPCLCGKQMRQGEPGPSVGEHWKFRDGRGYGTFTVIRVHGERVTLRPSPRAVARKDKTISVKTLRADYERVEASDER